MAKKRIGKLIPRRLTIRELAEMIARDLFTNGNGERAVFLKHFDAQDRYRGGWSEPAVADRVEKILAENAEREAQE